MDRYAKSGTSAILPSFPSCIIGRVSTFGANIPAAMARRTPSRSRLVPQKLALYVRHFGKANIGLISREVAETPVTSMAPSPCSVSKAGVEGSLLSDKLKREIDDKLVVLDEVCEAH